MRPRVEAFDVAVIPGRARCDEGCVEHGAEWIGAALGLVRLGARQSGAGFGHPRCTGDAGMGSEVSPDRRRQNLSVQSQATYRALQLLVLAHEQQSDSPAVGT